MQKTRQKSQDIDTVGLVGNAQVEAGRGGDQSRGRLRCQLDEIGAANAEVGSQQPDVGVPIFAQRALPLDAKLCSLVGVNFGNQALDVNLRAAGIEFVDDLAQLAVLRLGSADDEGVGRRVGLNLSAGAGLTATSGAASATGRTTRTRRHGTAGGRAADFA